MFRLMEDDDVVQRAMSKMFPTGFLLTTLPYDPQVSFVLSNGSIKTAMHQEPNLSFLIWEIKEISQDDI